MPDFEIRYFSEDGALIVVHVTSHETRAQAEALAQMNQHLHHRFEVLELKAARAM